MSDSRAISACVIGAGTMGAGIAAHLANLGHDVTLLDLSADSARAGLDRARRAKPPHFFLSDTADRIQVAGIDEGLGAIAQADWVCEAIIEKMEAKRALFEKIEPHLRPDAFISTNTSGLQIGLLAEGRPEDFRRRFLGTHFFNPPRYLKLIELIPTHETDPAIVESISAFLEAHAARRVVPAKDTPGFIANRFGMWAMFHAIHTAERLGLSIEQVDAITGPFLGRPRSGSFRLNDIVGLDIMKDVGDNLKSRCLDDPHRKVFELPRSMAFLMEKGWIGEKVGQGFYKREGTEFVALDLGTLAYRNRQDAGFPSLDAIANEPLGDRIREALDRRDEAGEFLREHLVPVLQYADYLKAEVSHSVQDFDRVMMWGFGWSDGPFAMIDQIGADKLGIAGERFYRGGAQRDWIGGYIPLRSEPEYRTIADYPVADSHDLFEVRDLGDDVRALVTGTKMGVMSPALVQALLAYLETWQGPLVLTSNARSFSAGFDLKFLIDSCEAERWSEVEESLRDLQILSVRMGELPSVAAIYGHTLGGGFEVAMGCPIVLAAAESQIGFPEAKVGLLPAGTGTARMRLLHQDNLKTLTDATKHLTLGVSASNAEEARRLGYLRPTDRICYHPDRLLTEAKQLALTVQPRALPVWKAVEGPLTGMIDRSQQEMKSRGEMTDYDETIGDKIKAVFAKTASWEDALARERHEFAELLHHALTQARIRHMLETGKPLRN